MTESMGTTRLRTRLRHDIQRPSELRIRELVIGAGIAAAIAVSAHSRFGWNVALVAFVFLAGVGAMLAVTDVRSQRIPNSILIPAYPIAIVLLAGACVTGAEPDAFVRAVVGGLASWLVHFVVCLAWPTALGFGDVKLAGLLGGYLAFADWATLVTGTLAAFVLAGLFSIALLSTRRASRQTSITFAPWMLLGAAFGLAVARPAVERYLEVLA